jgi:hypothetical protein
MPRNAAAVSQSPSRLERRVVAAAEAALTSEKSVSSVGVLAQIGWLPRGLVDDWRRGRVDYLERVASVAPDTLAGALEHLRRWGCARDSNRPRSLTGQLRATGGACGSLPTPTRRWSAQVEEAALEAAEAQCLFPGCPSQRRGDRPPRWHARQRPGRALGGRAGAGRAGGHPRRGRLGAAPGHRLRCAADVRHGPCGRPRAGTARRRAGLDRLAEPVTGGRARGGRPGSTASIR